MLAHLARFCVRRKWFVLHGVRIPLLVVVNTLAAVGGSAFSTDFTPPDSESADVVEQITAVSPERAGFTGQVVFRAVQGVDDPAVRGAMEELFRALDGLDGVDVQSPYAEDVRRQASPDRKIAFAQLNITDRDQTEFLDFSETVQALDDSITTGPNRIDGLTIETEVRSSAVRLAPGERQEPVARRGVVVKRNGRCEHFRPAERVVGYPIEVLVLEAAPARIARSLASVGRQQGAYPSRRPPAQALGRRRGTKWIARHRAGAPTGRPPLGPWHHERSPSRISRARAPSAGIPAAGRDG